jgi:hypothetical protein
MTAIVTGVYRQGKLELLETPQGLREGPVRVVLIEQEGPVPPRRHLTFGKYQGGRLSTLEDFRQAQWHGEVEFDARHGS